LESGEVDIFDSRAVAEHVQNSADGDVSTAVERLEEGTGDWVRAVGAGGESWGSLPVFKFAPAGKREELSC